jgi:dienelactone hydrolase
MRLLECLLLIALLVAALLRLRGAHRETITLGTTVLAAALLTAHGWIDHTRWQMYPAYTGVALLPLLLLPHIDTSALLRRSAQGLIVLLVLVSGLLAWVLPIPKLPVPAGPHAVGTASLLVEDPERPDPYVTGEARSFMLQIWYPAMTLENASTIPWMPDARAFSSAIGAQLGLPGFILNHLDLIPSNAVARAPILVGAGKLPVVIYSHGWNGSRQVAANQCERLASEGFIVLAPDHTHGAFGTRFPDGRVLLNRPSAMPPDEPADARQAGIEKLVDMYAGDLVTVLDMLPQLDTEIDNPVRGHYDLSNVGLFGHSTGGGAVVEVRATDKRLRAVVGLDPWVEPVSPDLRTAAIDTPFVSIRCEDWVQHRKVNNAILATMLAQMPGEKRDLYIEGTKHADFVLLPMLSPLASVLGQTGSIEAARGLRVVEDYLVSYFTHYLKDATQPAFPDSARYPEVKEVTNPAL